MRTLLPIHIFAGAMAIVLGFVALYAAKGGRLHRQSGRLFLYAMVTMSVTASLIYAVRGEDGSVIGGLMAAYFVVTALTTVRPPSVGSRWLDRGATLVGLTIGVGCIARGVESLARGSMVSNDVPVPMLFFLGTVVLLAVWSDLRIMRSGALTGRPRLKRHLWRMCFALWTATGSFFLGQADEFPQALRIPALLAFLAFLPLLLMAYWLWRVRAKGGYRPTAGARPRMEMGEGVA